MSTIEIKNYIKDELLFTHIAEDNTVLNTLKKGIHDGVDFRYAELVSADLAGADFRNADFRFVDIRDSDLTFADFRGAKFRGADFRGADFRDTDFRGADLKYANYTQGQIDSAITDETTIF